MASPLKILQLGCGSMGSRRLRDLRVRPDVTLRLYDARDDRRAAAQGRFEVAGFRTLEEALAWGPDALVISTPPGTKGAMARWAVEHGVHHFVEADIWSYGVAPLAQLHPELVSAPSLSFAFLPVVQTLLARVPAAIGRLLGYQFFLAGEMASWHPAEGAEYYGRHRDTAPAREMVPFELAWLAPLFGRPRAVSGRFGRYSGNPAAIEDTWSLMLELEGGGTGQLTVTMASPQNFRGGCAFGTEGSAHWDINRGEIVLRGRGGPGPETLHCGEIGHRIEPMYAAEINCYVDAIRGGAPWPHSYADYQHAIATLAAAERWSELSSTRFGLQPNSGRNADSAQRVEDNALHQGLFPIEPALEPARTLPSPAA